MSAVITINAIKQADAGSMLHTAFGSVRTWSDFLADCIRDRTSFHGLQLHPVCYLRSSTGRIARPLYDRQTVLDFIVTAHARGATLAGHRKPEMIRVEIEVDELELPPSWRNARLVS